MASLSLEDLRIENKVLLAILSEDNGSDVFIKKIVYSLNEEIKKYNLIFVNIPGYQENIETFDFDEECSQMPNFNGMLLLILYGCAYKNSSGFDKLLQNDIKTMFQTKCIQQLYQEYIIILPKAFQVMLKKYQTTIKGNNK